MSAPPIIKVAILEDQDEIRNGLAVLINGTDGYRTTGVFRSAEEAIAQIGANLPHVVLADIGLPSASGIEAVRQMKNTWPQLLFLMLTVYDDDARVFEAICAGACGYLLKKTPPAKLIESIQDVVSGGAPMSPQIARRVIELFRVKQPPKHAEYLLTPHEVRLLKLLVEGHNYKTAAAEVGVTPHAISFHMRHIYEKLQVHSKSAAVAKALREGIVG